MEPEKKDQRVTIMMSESELEAVDRWAHHHMLKSRGEAIRMLLSAALQLMPLVGNLRRQVHGQRDKSSPEFLKAVDAVTAATTTIQRFIAKSGNLESGNDVDYEPSSSYAFAGGDTELIMEIAAFLLAGDASEGVSEREEFVIERIQEGHDDETIADLMEVSEHGIKNYILMLTKKYGVDSRDELPDALPITVKPALQPAIEQRPRKLVIKRRVRLKDN